MVKKTRKKINFKRLVILILFLYVLVFTINTIINIPIKNIYIKNNTILSDQEVIDIAEIKDYPSIVTTMSFLLEKKLIDNTYIKDAKVKKSFFSVITITIDENKPIFYDRLLTKIVLQDGKLVDGIFNVGTVINFIPDTVREIFIREMAKVDQDVIERISEIEYKPNEVDKERFFLTMKDGNYVYLTGKKITEVNEYLNIVETLNNKKGILYLDDAGFFEVIEDKVD